MATEVSAKRVQALVKQGKNMREVADAIGVPVSVIGPHFYRAEVENSPSLKVKNPTPAGIKRMRDSDNLRWERIAARTGLSVAAVKAAYAEAGGSKMDLLGRNGSGGARKASGGGRKKTTARGGGAKKTTARGGRKTSTGGRKKTASVRRARTRAQRQQRVSNPS